MSIYLQLVDVLLGCVQLDYKDRTGYYGKARRSAEKRPLVNFVKSRLGLREQEPFMRNGESLSRLGRNLLLHGTEGAAVSNKRRVRL